MGGIGNKRNRGGRCTDEMHPLDVRRFHRAGLLTPGGRFSWQWTRNGEATSTIDLRMNAGEVLLDYRNRSAHRNDGEWEPMSYAVHLDWTPCGFGGLRAWWLCPAVGCGRRVAVLYGGRMFACRQCSRLTYRSQRESVDDRAKRRAGSIRRRLGWDAGILNTNGPKPKGMHRRTFERLQAKHDAHAMAAQAGIAAKLESLRARLEGQLYYWRQRRQDGRISENGERQN